MKWTGLHLVASLGAGASLVTAQIDTASSVSNTYTYAFNSGSTNIIYSTDTAVTSMTYSASGTIVASPSSVPFYNVSSVGTQATSSMTASSNFTLPSATATATMGPNFVVQNSNAYVMPNNIDTSSLPTFSWDLTNETEYSRGLICAQQTRFCQVAGCAEAGATIDYNFCNVDTMATRCTCNKGNSNLQQWSWPVQMSDCLTRGSTCNTACSQPGGSTASRAACKKACDAAFSDNCGFPGNFAANYAVNKESDKPSLSMVQGGTAGDGALTLKAVTSVMAIVAVSTLVFAVI